MSRATTTRARDCHAVLVRLAGPPPADLVARWREASGRVWTDRVPGPADGPAAERRRAAELARPTSALRCVLLSYEDDPVDLVLVAHRTRLDARGLRLLAESGVDGGADPASWSPPDAGPAPDWGPAAAAPITMSRAVPSAHVGDEDTWTSALALTLARYTGDDSPAVGTARGAVPEGRAPSAGLLLDLDAGPAEQRYTPCLAPPFPVTVSVVGNAAGEVDVRCHHNPTEVAPAIAGAFVRHLVHVHAQLAEGVPAEGVELLDDAERAAVVALGQGDRPEPLPPGGIPAAFRYAVADSPDAPAVSDGTTEVTYRELDLWSDRIAAGLRDRGACPGDRVVVCLDRTTALIACLLGVLKAGCAYVPLETTYPLDRLAHAVVDAEPTVVITTSPDLAERAGGRAATPEQLTAADRPVRSGPSSDPSPDDPAYVIYTSGSTGRPKGVVVPHRNVLSLVRGTRGRFGLGGGDVWTMFHSAAFDFSVWEVWGCLLTGGRLVVVPHAVSRDPEAFRDLLVEERVTVLNQTPSAFNQLLTTDHRAVAVRLVVFGGEALDAGVLLPWFDVHPEGDCEVVNMYGITETTVHVTAQRLGRGDALAGTRSVGRALPGWSVRVVDRAGRLLPPGAVGEIHVGGAGVATGYFGRPELTADRFVPDPFSGGVVYRSGDLGRLLPDGRLEHLGRIDSQVKVRGFRIELDEVRSVLLEDPDVSAAAVVVHRGAPGDLAAVRLDAYVVLFPGGDTGRVRRRAAAFLPEHMVPATLTALPALPLTSNGKLDRAALPDPVPPPPVAVDLDDGLLGALVEVWSEVFGTAVGPEHDFFELGGNSLYAVRIGAAMKARNLPAPPLRELYRNPTARGLAEQLGGTRAAADAVRPVEG